MRLSLLIEPEDGIEYAALADLARHAEHLGFHAIYVSDHYQPAFGWHGIGAPDSWALLAALARDTERIAIGTLVTPVTLRRPSTLMKLVATVAYIAGASYAVKTQGMDGSTTVGPRVHLGLGAGWLASEHEQLGLGFPEPPIRVAILEDHLRTVHELWNPEHVRVTVSGAHVSFQDTPFAPRPQPRPRIIVGGKGRKVMPRLAGTYADEFNVPAVADDEMHALRSAFIAARREAARAPSAVTFSTKRGILIGRDRFDLRARTRRMQHLASDVRSSDAYLSWLRERHWIVGTPDEAMSKVSALGAGGVEHLILQHLLPHDLPALDLIAEYFITPNDGEQH